MRQAIQIDWKGNELSMNQQTDKVQKEGSCQSQKNLTFQTPQRLRSSTNSTLLTIVLHVENELFTCGISRVRQSNRALLGLRVRARAELIQNDDVFVVIRATARTAPRVTRSIVFNIITLTGY